jgi:hypothetical protein
MCCRLRDSFFANSAAEKKMPALPDAADIAGFADVC